MPRTAREKLSRIWRLGLPASSAVAFTTAGALSFLFGAADSVAFFASPVGNSPPSAAALAPRRFEPLPASIREAPSRVARVRSGETLAALLLKEGLTSPEAHAAAMAAGEYVDLRQIRAGSRFAVFQDEKTGRSRFELAFDGKGVLELAYDTAATADAWRARFRPFTREVAISRVEGKLEGAFEDSIERAGGPGDLAYSVADVLQWDLDFARDLRAGDEFEILFEEVFLDGERFGLGEVLAVVYSNRGRRLEAYRFAGLPGVQAGHYDEEGRPLEKMFLRSPLPYSRITSRFSGRRFHPVLKAYRPHYGVDYGAPTGTPVRATAAGVVTFVGWDGGGGKTVKVRHPNEFLSCYLHLSRFAEGLVVGDRVGQGEVVAYVGSTGLATAPHLDYRVQQRGRWIDPLSLKSVPADPIPVAARLEFLERRDAMRLALATGVGTPAASAEVGAQTADVRRETANAVPRAGTRR